MNTPMNFIIPTDYFVKVLNQTIMSYPPIINVPRYDENGRLIRHEQEVMPYNITDICSQCVKVAAAPNSDDGKIFIAEVRYNLRNFDREVNGILMQEITRFLNYLIQLFRQRGWYDSFGTAPQRFVGFTTGTLDIELRSV